jgi:hypothetical protein
MSRFDIGEAFQYHGTPYVIVQVPTRDSVVAKDQQHGTTVTFLLDDLLNAWVSRELRFPYKSGLGRRAQTTDLETLPVLPDLTQIAEECRQLARQRYSLVRELLMIPQVKRTRELIEQRIAA